MINYINGLLENHGWQIFIINKEIGIGIQTSYAGIKKLDEKGWFFIYNYNDENNKTIWYLAFDTIDQKILFEKLYKISGVWVKSAYYISFLDVKQLDKAIKEVDISFFNKVQWIGPKTAKKILVELKLDLDRKDIDKLNIDKKLLDKIIKYFKSLGYNELSVKNTIKTYKGKIAETDIKEIYKFIIDNINP